MNLPVTRVAKKLMLIRTIPTQLTTVKMQIPVTLLTWCMILTVIKTPKIAPIGMIPMRIDVAANELMVMLQCWMRVSIGTEVIYFIMLQPKLRALREMIRPKNIIFLSLRVRTSRQGFRLNCDLSDFAFHPYFLWTWVFRRLRIFPIGRRLCL